jgi:hypothetical protein
VKSRLTIRQVFAAIVAAAIALTPSSRLAMAAMPSDAPAMAHEMVMPSTDAAHGLTQDTSQDTAMSMPGDETVEMGAGTPCCPHKAPSPVDCDKCVMMAGCMAKCFSGTAATAIYLLPRLAAVIVPQRDEARLTSFGRPPPEHPPRSLV